MVIQGLFFTGCSEFLCSCILLTSWPNFPKTQNCPQISVVHFQCVLLAMQKFFEVKVGVHHSHTLYIPKFRAI